MRWTGWTWSRALKADPKATSELAQSISDWPHVLARLFPRHAEPPEEVRRIRPARSVRERLLGQSGLQAAAGSQSDGGHALPGGPGFPEGNRQGPYDFRRQESASQLAGGRRALRHQLERRGRGRRDQHGAPQLGQEHHRPEPGIHRQGLYSRPPGHRLLLQGLAVRRRPVVARA